jgi:hypothetical protein
MDTFWKHVAAVFTAAVQQAVSRGGVVRDSLVHSFPRLLALLESTLDKCVRETDVPGVSTSISAANRQALMHALQPLQEAFLAASLARMQQAVSGLYAPGNVRTLPQAVTQCVGYASDLQGLHPELQAFMLAHGKKPEDPACCSGSSDCGVTHCSPIKTALGNKFLWLFCGLPLL